MTNENNDKQQTEDKAATEGNDINNESAEVKGSATSGSEGQSSKEKETETESENAKETETKQETIRFALADDKLMWSTNSKSIELSAFTQVTGAEISKQHEDYERVKSAIDLGVLVKLPADTEFPKFKSKELTYGKVQEDEAAKIRKAYSTKEYLELLQDDVIKKIQDIDNPQHIIKLIQAERRGENREHVERKSVLSSLREKLRKLDVNGVYEIEIEDL